MFEGLIVKITKAEISTLWYASEIGRDFLVVREFLDNGHAYRVVQPYSDLELIPPKRWIRLFDCEIVRKENFRLLYSAKILSV